MGWVVGLWKDVNKLDSEKYLIEWPKILFYFYNGEGTMCVITVADIGKLLGFLASMLNYK